MKCEFATTAVPTTEVLRFIVQQAVNIQKGGGRLIAGDGTTLNTLAHNQCLFWNERIAHALSPNFPGLRTAIVEDGNGKANSDGDYGHCIGLCTYLDEIFAFDASIAQQGGIHEKRPVKIWRASDVASLREQLAATFGGTWEGLDRAVNFWRENEKQPFGCYIYRF